MKDPTCEYIEDAIYEALQPFRERGCNVIAHVAVNEEYTLFRILILIDQMSVTDQKISTIHGSHDVLRLCLSTVQSDLVTLLRLHKSAIPQNLSQWFCPPYVRPQLASVPVP